MSNNLIPGFEEIYNHKDDLFNHVLFRQAYFIYANEPNGALFKDMRKQDLIEKLQSVNRNLLHFQHVGETKNSSWIKLGMIDSLQSNLIVKIGVDLSDDGKGAFSMGEILENTEKKNKLFETRDVFIHDQGYILPKIEEISEKFDLKLRTEGQIFYSGVVRKY